MWKIFAGSYLKRKVKTFSECYNLIFAETAKRYTDIPIICVGGFRNGKSIIDAVNSGKTDFVSLCRPFICEPDLINKIKNIIIFRKMASNIIYNNNNNMTHLQIIKHLTTNPRTIPQPYTQQIQNQIPNELWQTPLTTITTQFENILGLDSLIDAFKVLHGKQTVDNPKDFKKRIIYEEFFFFQ